MAQKIKLMAHDNKPRACCLVNLSDTSSLPTSGCANYVAAFSAVQNWRVLAACRAKVHVGFCRIQGSIVSKIPDKTLSELRIARAYIKLLCIPEGRSGASVSLAWIGNCEIRIFEGPQANSDGMPSFLLELFDHGAKTSVDSFSCHKIEDAVVVFEEFISQAGHEEPGLDDAETKN